MATYLFTWNPERWGWTYLQDSIDAIKDDGYCDESWSCGVTKRIRIGDRAFLMKLGAEPRGIVGSGWVHSKVYERRHWDDAKAAKGQVALYVRVHWDTILDPNKDIFPRAWLNSPHFSKMHWEPQASGVTIHDEVAEALEQAWANFLKRPRIYPSLPLADEVESGRTFIEGATRKITVNSYERSPEARDICLNHYGLDCFVCGFNFERNYGELGAGFIHVHHLKALSTIRRQYQLHPIRDLRPVCPNCHAMLHRREPAYSIEELKALLPRE